MTIGVLAFAATCILMARKIKRRCINDPRLGQLAARAEQVPYRALPPGTA